MRFRKVFVLALAIATAAASMPTLSAYQAKPVDFTGIWTGTLTPTAGGEASGAHLDLKQKGQELTGTAGPDANRQGPIAEAKITAVKDVTSVTFTVTQPNGVVLNFDLKLVEGRLKGKVIGTRDGETREAVLDVGRNKLPS